MQNLEEMPAREGRCGGSWRCTEHAQTSYEGETETYQDEVGAPKQRRVPSLAPISDRDKQQPCGAITDTKEWEFSSPKNLRLQA